MKEIENLLGETADTVQSLVNRGDIGSQDISRFVSAFEPLKYFSGEGLFAMIALKNDSIRKAAIDKINSIQESLGQLMKNPSFVKGLSDTDFDTMILFRLIQCRDSLMIVLTGSTWHPQS